jgi:hypothetical protein
VFSPLAFSQGLAILFEASGGAPHNAYGLSPLRCEIPLRSIVRQNDKQLSFLQGLIILLEACSGTSYNAYGFAATNVKQFTFA